MSVFKLKTSRDFSLLTILLITISLFGCKKDQHELDQIKETIINAVYLKNDTGVFIPISGKAKIKHSPNFSYSQNQLSIKSNSVENKNNAFTPGLFPFTAVSKSLSSYNLNAYYSSSPAYSYADWYLLSNGTRIAYLGSGDQGAINFTATLSCGIDYTVEREYYDIYIGQTVIQRSDSYSAFNYITTPGFGAEASGANVKIGDINGNNIPDMVLMSNDNPIGANTYRYQFLMDMGANGQASFTTSIKNIPAGINEAEGSGVALGDIDGNGVTDILLMSYDAPNGPNSFVYKIGFNLNSSGDPAYWTGNYSVTGVSDYAHGAAASLVDIDGNGVIDLVFMAVDKPGGISTATCRYKVGFNLATSGSTSNWTTWYNAGGFGTLAQGLGLDFFRSSGQLYMFFGVLDHGTFNVYRARVSSMNSNGTINTNTIGSYLPSNIMNLGTNAQGGGIAFADFDNNGILDYVLMANDNPPGQNSFRYFIGYNMTSPTNPNPGNYWCSY